MENDIVFPTKRICAYCDVTFEKSDIFTHSDHMASHNFTPSQWTEAYRRIQDGKEKMKKAEKEV